MALQSNHKDLLAKRLKQELSLLAPELSAKTLADADSDPVIELKDGANVVALAAIKRRTFTGFNIVNEISASAGNGYPEHELWLAVKNDISFERLAKLTKATSSMGCSTWKFIKTVAAPALADITEANVSLEMPNDARVGHSGQ